LPMPRGQHSLSTNDARCSLFNSERDIPVESAQENDPFELRPLPILVALALKVVLFRFL